MKTDSNSDSDLFTQRPKTLESRKAVKTGTRVVIEKQDSKTMHGKIYFRDHDWNWYQAPFKIDKAKVRSM